MSESQAKYAIGDVVKVAECTVQRVLYDGDTGFSYLVRCVSGEDYSDSLVTEAELQARETEDSDG